MAIYKNREVSVISPNYQFRTPDVVTVMYMDGSHENVPFGQVKYTQAEKDSLVKNNPSIFDNVEVVKDEDVKAVRLGVTPPSDPEFKQMAEDKARREKMEEETRKNMEAAKAEAEKNLDKKLDAPVPTTKAKAN